MVVEIIINEHMISCMFNETLLVHPHCNDHTILQDCMDQIVQHVYDEAPDAWLTVRDDRLDAPADVRYIREVMGESHGKTRH